MRTVIFVLSALLCLCIAISTQAATITVDDDGPADFNSIQAAINNANDGDTVLVNPGRYIEAINFNGKAITLTGSDPENDAAVAATVIDGSGAGSVVVFANSESSYAVLTGFTITNGSAVDGGGIYCENSDPTITRCVITGNSASAKGGGIFGLDSNATISRCRISDNVAVEGGAIHSGGGLGRRCDNITPGSNLTITNCLINSNTAPTGGGIYCNRSSFVQIRNCTIVMNQASYPGSIYIDDRCSGPANSIVNCIIWSNIPDQYDYMNYPPTFSCMESGPLDLNNVYADPCFVDPDANDFHLLSNSPCIDTGDPSGDYGGQVDIDGNVRDMAYGVDMGAYEIYSPTVLVTKPGLGQTWVTGSRRQIAWTSKAYDGTVDILLSLDGGGFWSTMLADMPAQGQYLWNVPASIDSQQCIIKAMPELPDSNYLIVDSGLFTIGPDISGESTDATWPTLGSGIRRDGLSDFLGPELGCLKWQFQPDGPVSSSVAIAQDGTVYIGCEDANLYALNSDGTTAWVFDANSPITSSPTVGPDGTIYIGTESGRFWAVGSDGNDSWPFDANGPVYSSAAVSADGNTIYFGSEQGILYALDDSGTPQWTFETAGPGPNIPGSIMASPSIGADGVIFIGSIYDPNLYALDPNGTVKWNCPFASGGWPVTAPVVAPDGMIYQTLAHDSNLYAIEPDGDIAWAANLADTESGWFESYCWDPDNICEDSSYWSYHTGDSGYAEPVIGPDGTIYVSLCDPYLRAVSPDGKIKWVTRLGMMGGFALTIGPNGMIYAASDDGYLCVVDEDGNELSRFKADDYLGYPVIAEEGTIIVVGSQDNSMLNNNGGHSVWAITSNQCEGQQYVLRRPYDLHSDPGMNLNDYALLAQHWLGCTDMKVNSTCFPLPDETYLTGDIDRDYYVDIEDLKEIAENWLSQD